jgi:hypothetical protein
MELCSRDVLSADRRHNVDNPPSQMIWKDLALKLKKSSQRVEIFKDTRPYASYYRTCEAQGHVPHGASPECPLYQIHVICQSNMALKELVKSVKPQI